MCKEGLPGWPIWKVLLGLHGLLGHGTWPPRLATGAVWLTVGWVSLAGLLGALSRGLSPSNPTG